MVSLTRTYLVEYKMKQVNIHIETSFGSKFQEQFARDTLLNVLKAWRSFCINSHQKNKITVEIDGAAIQHLDWFNFRKK